DHVAAILGRMVEVDMQVALRLQRNVYEAVLRQLLEHVIEKADPGRDFGGAATVESDAALDPRLLGVALDRRDPHLMSPSRCPRTESRGPGRRLLTRSAQIHHRAAGP